MTDQDQKVPYSYTDTWGLSPKAAVDVWQAQINVLFDAKLRDTTGLGAYCKVAACMLGPLALGRASMGPQTFDRATNKISRDGLDHIMVQVYESGSCRERHNKTANETRPGDIWITDLSRPLATEISTATNLNLVLPRALISPLLKEEDTHHLRIIDGQTVLAKLLKNHMSALLEMAPEISLSETNAIASPTLELVAAVLNGNVTDSTKQGIQTSIKSEVLRYIRQNTSTNQLSPQSIADRFGMSLRKLQYLFESEGGVANLIQEHRLRTARALLMDNATVDLSIEQIATQCGFSHLPSFSRAFRNRFGLSPRSYRMLSRSHLPSTDSRSLNQLDWHHWLSQMPV